MRMSYSRAVRVVGRRVSLGSPMRAEAPPSLAAYVVICRTWLEHRSIEGGLKLSIQALSPGQWLASLPAAAPQDRLHGCELRTPGRPGNEGPGNVSNGSGAEVAP